MNIDNDIYNCNLCGNMVEKFLNSKTVSIGKNNNIVLLGETPANEGWRKSGVAWYNTDNKIIPSGIVMQKLLDILELKLEDTYFLETVKCYPKDRKYLDECSNNCKDFLYKQLNIINPDIILTLGDTATKSILDFKYNKFGDVVGKIFEINNMIVIPIYHPSPISPKSYNGNVEIFYEIKKMLNNKKKVLKK